MAQAGRQPDSDVTVAQLLDQYVSTAGWDVSTRVSNLGYIRRTIKPALGSTQVRKVRGPLLDTLYARLMRCGNLACTGRPFTEHRNVPDLRPDPSDPRLEWEQAADRVRAAIRRLLAHEVPAARLHEVRRFTAEWERQASVRLRDGDLAAAAAYDRHGRIRAADQEAAYQRAASLWLADHLRGKDVLLLAGSNAEAAELSRRVQAKLAQMGRVGPPQATLSDGNHAGVGDLIRARLNTEIDAGGRRLTNRDTLAVTVGASLRHAWTRSVMTSPVAPRLMTRGSSSRIWPA